MPYNDAVQMGQPPPRLMYIPKRELRSEKGVYIVMTRNGNFTDVIAFASLGMSFVNRTDAMKQIVWPSGNEGD